MATTLALQPPRVRLVDDNGQITRAWYAYMERLQERVGGYDGPSTIDLAQSDDDDSGLEEFKHEFSKALDALAVQPPQIQEQRIESLETEVAQLRELVAVLLSEIDGLKQGPSE